MVMGSEAARWTTLAEMDHKRLKAGFSLASATLLGKRIEEANVTFQQILGVRARILDEDDHF